ncbi:MAG: flagellar assembly protein FliW [Thermodesulfobacteriota bacterium]
MTSIETRFGTIEYDPASTVTFPEGLIGFGHLREFVVLPKEVTDPLFGLQSVEDGRVAFMLASPWQYFPDYHVQPDKRELDLLGITLDDEFFVLVTITLQDDQSITANLAAPIVYTPKTDRAVQMVLETTTYSTRTPLPMRSKDNEAASPEAQTVNE